MKFLKEFKEFNYEVITEAAQDGRPSKLFVKGIIQRADAINQNGRIYPRDILFKEIENYKKVVAERRATGELDHCLLGTTEVLTQDGWKQLIDVSKEDKVHTINTETNAIELSNIENKIEVDYAGTMYRLINGKQLDVVMSPNHRVLLWDRYNKPYYTTAQEMFENNASGNGRLSHSCLKTSGDWKGYNIGETIKIPGTGYEIPSMAFAGMFGFWLAEGYADRLKHGKGQKHSYRIQITQKKEQNFEAIRNMLKATELPWAEYTRKNDTKDWIICNKELHSFFVNFGKAKDKFIPAEFKAWPKPLLDEMLKWMLIGDGRNRHDKVSGRLIKEYSTVSKKLADDVSEVMFKLGYRPNIKTLITTKDGYIAGHPVKAENCLPLYTVAANKSKTWTDKRFIKIIPENFEGKIYCLTTPNHNFLIRSNGFVCWTGNCDEPVVNLKNVSHLITDIWNDGNDVYGKLEILPTPMGNIARALLESNVKVGISSRALGSVQSKGEADIVQDDLHLICWDLVSEPSTAQAFMVMEGRNYSKEEVKAFISKNDRINRAANDILSLINKK